MQEALFYDELPSGKVKCLLCPWYCEIGNGEHGNCRIRVNYEGKLYTEVFNKVASLAVDHMEKKPLYHFYPGKLILSVGLTGCNLHCKFCQNHRISQCAASDFHSFYEINAEKIVEKALSIPNNIGIAYTYNEPFTFYEFMGEIAFKAKKVGLKNVVVSNGFINPEPLKALIPYIDAFNIDLKSFSSVFYSNYTKGNLEPVLDCLKTISKSGSHLEITHLVIPGLNDNPNEFREMIDWISSEAGNHVPLHLSRYFPVYKLSNPPTPLNVLEQFYEIATKKMDYVFLGNVISDSKSTTYCRKCSEVLITRNNVTVEIKGIDFNGLCSKCNEASGIII